MNLRMLKIKTRMLVFFLITIIAVMLGVMVINSQITKHALNTNLTNVLYTMSNIASQGVKMGLEFSDSDAVQDALKSFTDQELFSYVSVENREGESVYTFRRDGFPEIKENDITKLNFDGEIFKQVPVTSDDQDIGVITIGVRLDDRDKALAKASLYTFLLALGIIGLFVIITNYIANGIAVPVQKIRKIADELAHGNLDHDLDDKLKIGHEIGELVESFRQMILSQKEKADAALQISKGNLDVQVKVLSEADILGKAMNSMKDSVQAMMEDADSLVNAAIEGQLEVRANVSRHDGDFAKIINGFNKTLDAFLGPLSKVVESLQKIEDNDLTCKITEIYKGNHAETVQTLNTAIEKLDRNLLHISNLAEQIATGTQEINQGSQAVAQGASDQASSLEEVSSSLQEMSSITEQNTSNAKEAKALSESARESTSRGVDSMNDLSIAIERIKDSSDETYKIVNTIDEIAFQTNLLALNAAVEAARAGEAGKGFAVVAEEVRNLAVRSAEAAKNTANMIEESVKNAGSGVSLSQKVLNNLLEINERVVKVGEVMAEIAMASEQQNQGIDQINQAVEQMNRVTQQTAANSEEAASSTEELASQAKEIWNMISEFTLSSGNSSYVQPANGNKNGNSHSFNAEPMKMLNV